MKDSLWVIEVSPKSRDRCLYKRQEKTHKGEKATEDGGRGHSEIATSQGSPGATMSCKNQGRVPLQSFRGRPALPIPGVWNSTLQNCVRIYFCFKPVCGLLFLRPWEMDALSLHLYISNSFRPHSDSTQWSWTLAR